MNSIGIDPGISGGLALIPEEGEPIVLVMPTIKVAKGKKMMNHIDIQAVLDILDEWNSYGQTIAHLEKTWAMRPMRRNKQTGGMEQGATQGVSSVFTSGEGYGILQTALVANKIGFELVTPQKWMGTVMPGYPKGAKQKPSIQWAIQKYPLLDLRRSDKCRTAHDGICDALAIAYYGRLREGKP